MRITAFRTIRTCCIVMSFMLLLFGCFDILQISAAEPVFKSINRKSILIAVSPTNIANSHAIGELIKTEEWKRFCPLFVAKLDESYQKAKSSPDFSNEIDQWFQKTVGGALNKKEVTSKDLIEALFQHVNAVVLAADLDFRNNTPNVEGDVILIVDFNPMEFQGILDFVKEGVHYKTLDKKQDSLVLGSMDNKVVLATTRWNNSGKYLIVLTSSKADTDKVFDAFKKISDPDAYLKESKDIMALVEFSPQLPEKLRAQIKDEISKEVDSKRRDEKNFSLSILEKIESVSFRIHEKDGETFVHLKVSTTSKENAEELRRMADGGLAFLSFIMTGRELKPEEKLVMNVVDNITPTCQESDYVMTMKLDTSTLELMKIILNEAVDKMK